MKKQLFLAAALLAPGLSATPALALKTNRLYDVAFEGNVVGTWRLRNRVVDLGDRCEYTVKWQNLHEPYPLKRSVQCQIQELKASDEFDCERSRRSFFPTMVYKKTGGPCDGFDEFGQQTRVSRLIAGETDDGTLFGIVDMISIGDIQSLYVAVH
jgi:hypothetical protein